DPDRQPSALVDAGCPPAVGHQRPLLRPLERLRAPLVLQDRRGVQRGSRAPAQVLSGLTSVAGVAGGPRQVARSLSPAIHNAGYRALGLDWVYVGFPVAAEGPGAVAVLRGLGGSGVAGVNVTMPHKLAAVEAVDRLAGQAAVVGAVNAVEVTGSELVGWNTDGEGLASFLVRVTDTGLDGCCLVVIGAGGSARSVVSGLVLAGAGSLTVLARDPGPAAALAPMAGEGPFRAL